MSDTSIATPSAQRVRWRTSERADCIYPAVFNHRPEVTLFGCLSHMRRKVVAALQVGEKRLVPVYSDIRELYRLEARTDELGLTHEQRGHLRHVRAKPILKRIQKMLWDIRQEEIQRGTLFGKLKEALDYAYHQ
jgi:Transposase IS66 family